MARHIVLLAEPTETPIFFTFIGFGWPKGFRSVHKWHFGEERFHHTSVPLKSPMHAQPPRAFTPNLRLSSEPVHAMQQWWSRQAILIQMWNLAGPVTNGCDDVWRPKLPISFFYLAALDRLDSIQWIIYSVLPLILIMSSNLYQMLVSRPTIWSFIYIWVSLLIIYISNPDLKEI